MGRTERCPVCREPLPRRAATCPRCGPGDDLVLESAHVETRAGVGAEVDLGDRRPRWVLVAGAAGVVALLGLAAASMGAGEGALPVAPSTTVPEPSTSAPVPSSPTTTAVERDRFVVERLATPLLTEPTGAVVYGLSDDAEVVRIDVDRGEVSRRRLRGPRGERADGFSVLAREGGAVLAAPGGRGALSVPDGPGSTARWLSGRGARVVPAADPGSVWRLERRDDGSQAAEQLGSDGAPLGPAFDVPASATVLGDDGTGRLLAKAPGGTYALDAGGPTRLADGEPLAWNAAWLVVTACDARLACTWRVADRASGAVREVPGRAGRPGVAAALSPDGSWLAELGGILDMRLDVVDLSTGERQQLAGPVGDAWGFGYASAGMWWAPDGRHLFWLDDEGRVLVWSPGGSVTVLDRHGVLPKLRSLSVAPAEPTSVS